MQPTSVAKIYIIVTCSRQPSTVIRHDLNIIPWLLTSKVHLCDYYYAIIVKNIGQQSETIGSLHCRTPLILTTAFSLSHVAPIIWYWATSTTTIWTSSFCLAVSPSCTANYCLLRGYVSLGYTTTMSHCDLYIVSCPLTNGTRSTKLSYLPTNTGPINSSKTLDIVSFLPLWFTTFRDSWAKFITLCVKLEGTTNCSETFAFFLKCL